ncbi:MAG: divalent-cation tolerance protein CutA [Caldimonas sp.]
MTCIAVYTTVSTRDEARRIGRALVERRLAACAQITEIESFYRWACALQHDTEFRLMLKTTDERYDAIEHAIRELHGYGLPAIYALPLGRVYAPYAEWVERESSGTSDAPGDGA